MAKSRPAREPVSEKKSNPLRYGVLFLITGALIGSVFSMAFQSTSNTTPVASQQQDADLFNQVNVYSDRVALNPQDVSAWITLGNLYFDTSQPAKSIEAYSRALKINPNNPDVLTDMGVMHRAVGEYQKALDTFAKAIETNPRHETARMNTGVVLLHDLGDRAGAILAWQELVRINPRAMNADGTLVADMLREMTGPEQGAGGGQKLLAPLNNSAN